MKNFVVSPFSTYAVVSIGLVLLGHFAFPDFPFLPKSIVDAISRRSVNIIFKNHLEEGRLEYKMKLEKLGSIFCAKWKIMEI